MNYTEALQYIHKTDWKGSRLGLERIKTLCHALGDPQKYLHFVHVAGTNGKGSVSTMLTSILSAAGYRVGLFTSPFLSEFRERIRIGEKLISEADLIAAVEAVRPFADAMEDAPTEFELMTALAFWYFRRQHCDLVVCEVGLGGELDSTNVIEKPLLSVITSIALDHTRELGNTLSAVARAKAGIVKRDRPVLFGEPENSVAASVICAYAEKLSAPYFETAPDALSVSETTLSGTVFSYRNYRDVRLSLCGAYQPKNAAVVLDAVERLRGEGLPISEDAVRRGLQCARWPGRFEVISRDPAVILDGAHNPHGARALLSSLELYFDADVHPIALCAVMADKEYDALFSTLAPRLSAVYCVAPKGHVRALKENKLAAFCGELGMESYAFGSVEDGARAALKAATDRSVPLLVFGSLYLYAEANDALTRLLTEGR